MSFGRDAVVVGVNSMKGMLRSSLKKSQIFFRKGRVVIVGMSLLS